LDELRRKQEEEERVRAEEEERRRREEEEERARKEKEEEERRKTEEEQITFHTPSGSRPSSEMSSRPTSSFKGPLPDFIHEMVPMNLIKVTAMD